MKGKEQAVHRAWWATMVAFLVHGLIVGTWVSRIPAVQAQLHLQNGPFGLTLLCAAIGAVVCIPITGHWLGKFGSRAVGTVATVAFGLTLVLPALAFDALTLGLGLFLYGAAAAAMDVAMNAQGVEVEKRLGTPTMSRFHAMFSLGAMAGSGIGGWVAGFEISPSLHLGASGLLYALAGVALWPVFLPGRGTAVAHESRLRWNKIPPVLWALTGIGFCMLLAEGAIADWTAIYLRQVLHAGPALAAQGYAAFSASMALFRLAGDWVTARLGPYRTLRGGSLVGLVGLLLALASPSAAWALPAFALVGVGYSVIIPLVFGSGGRVEGVSPGAGIATVTGIGYIGFIVGPPAIGFLSQLFTLRYALLLVVLCTIVSGVLAGAVRNINDCSAGPAPEAH